MPLNNDGRELIGPGVKSLFKFFVMGAERNVPLAPRAGPVGVAPEAVQDFGSVT